MVSHQTPLTSEAVRFALQHRSDAVDATAGKSLVVWLGAVSGLGEHDEVPTASSGGARTLGIMLRVGVGEESKEWRILQWNVQ